MALPILAFMARMGLKHGGSKAIQMAVKKFGKKAFAKATTKMSYTGRSAAKKTPKVKTYKDTKAHKETLKIRKRLGLGKNPTTKEVRKYFKDAYKPIRDKKMPERTRRMIKNWKFKKKT